MLVGHLAAGFVGKRLEPKLSLGVWVMAALFADFIFFPLLLLGIENVAVVPNVTINRVVGHDIGYSHSLLMLVIWAGLFAAVYFWRQRQVRAAALLFAVVLSHWLLDVISHRPDMPLVPGGKTLFGLGLWNSIPATLLVEGGFWLLAVVMYSRLTRPKKRLGTRFLDWSGAAHTRVVCKHQCQYGSRSSKWRNRRIDFFFTRNSMGLLDRPLASEPALTEENETAKSPRTAEFAKPA